MIKMTRIFVIMLIATILQSTYGLTTENVKAIIARDQEICLKKTPVPEDIKKKVAQKEIVDNEALKRYALCMGVILGFMNEDGSFNKETIRHTMAELMGSNKFDALVDFCIENPTNDAVTNAWNLAKCGHDNVHKEVFSQFTDAWWVLA